MSKKCYRFFGGLLNAQAKWLNKMSEKGYQLVRTGTLLYEFEKCKPDEVTYCVEFIGEKSKENATDYADFLEDMGYKVFFKNINLNYSVGKVRWRPWAERGGRIATNTTTFNREILIVQMSLLKSCIQRHWKCWNLPAQNLNLKKRNPFPCPHHKQKNSGAIMYRTSL